MSLLKPIKATGTVWHIEVLDKISDTEELQIFTEGFIETFEQRYSRFRDDSDLSKLNKNGVLKYPSDEFLDIIEKSKNMYETTKGIFNIAVGHKMETSGYDSGYSFIQTQDLAVPELTEVLSYSTEEILVQGGKLDLGGIGKGYLIDLLVKAYQTKYGLEYFIINGGGDIYATSDHNKAVEISLVHPKDKTLSIGTISILHQGFAASSPYVRVWKDRKTNIETNHLHTSNNIASYVVANNACEADVWATVLAIKPDLQSTSTTTKCFLLKDMDVLYRDGIFRLHI